MTVEVAFDGISCAFILTNTHLDRRTSNISGKIIRPVPDQGRAFSCLELFIGGRYCFHKVVRQRRPLHLSVLKGLIHQVKCRLVD